MIPQTVEHPPHFDAIGRVSTSARHRWLLADAYLLDSRPDDATKAVKEALELARRLDTKVTWESDAFPAPFTGHEGQGAGLDGSGGSVTSPDDIVETPGPGSRR